VIGRGPLMQRKRLELPAVVALGSNLGDRETLLREAVLLIGRIDGVRIWGASGIVESAALTPAGVDEEAPAYLNAVVGVHTSLTPLRLLHALQAIETRLGRVRTEHWGDRTIDLDLITMGEQRMETAELTLPHPRAAERAFVLVPWLQLEPAAHLVGNGSVASLAATTTDAVTAFPAAPLLPQVPR
jgi:2-amino-4-hydroxy-6-hydroxymethyldihydropteridine diphosphokinase